MSAPREHRERLLMPLLGWPPKFRVVTYRSADPMRRLVMPNRYPGQVIGLAIRLPEDGLRGHPVLSIMWAKPARWWKW